ncbi:hypothetical protein LINGRAHAP2_LOCUS24338 [Linum grandiflorum]
MKLMKRMTTLFVRKFVLQEQRRIASGVHGDSRWWLRVENETYHIFRWNAD